MVSGTRCSYVSVCGCVMVRGAVAPKGPMTYAGLSLEAGVGALRLEIGSQC
ncbi:MAG: hypothetical protein VX367_09450 [SAR324 cluster bacterium]|nr:hypothetical protein [SAR324 cluster bacterium]